METYKVKSPTGKIITIRGEGPPSETDLDEIFSSIEPAIYKKGGIYEQFGPRPPMIDPMPSPMGGIVETAANQPGVSLRVAGQAAGGLFGGPFGGIAGALGGEAIRQGIGRMYGVQDVDFPVVAKQFGQTATDAMFGELLGYAGGFGAEQLARRFGPQMKSAGIRLARNIIRPTGRLARRGEQISETALKEGVLSTNKARMMEKIKSKISSIDEEVTKLIRGAQNRSITAESSLKRMDALARRYRQLGDFNAADKVESVKSQLIEAHGLKQPVYKDVEIGQFEIRPGSPEKSVTPQIYETYSSDIKGPIRSLKGKARYESVRNPKTGRFMRSEPKREVFTSKKYVEEPTDIVALNIPRQGPRTQKIISVAPKEEFTISPGYKGISKTEPVLFGHKFRDIDIPEAQGFKRGQYRLLEGKRVGGGYDSATTTPEIQARQEYAGGMRRGIAREVPEVEDLNRRYGRLIDLGRAVEGRQSVSSRNNLFDLGDVFLGGMSVSNPKTGALIALRKILQRGQGPIARGFYGYEPTMFGFSDLLKSSAVRALLARHGE